MVRRRWGLAVGVATVFAVAALCRATGDAAAPAPVPKETVLWNFTCGADGANPSSGLALDKAGTLYGTTSLGGASETGTLFSLTPNGQTYSEKTLWGFEPVIDGAEPNGDVFIDPSGALVGTTMGGGSFGFGVVYRFLQNRKQPYQGEWTFGKPGDGAEPFDGVISDASGALFGTTQFGGAHGFGTVFKLTPSGGTYTESYHWSFGGPDDGRYPSTRVLFGANGTVYGTTSGCGTIFKLTPSGSGYVESIVYRFRGGVDGAAPSSALTRDASGALYGTTYFGGGFGCAEGCGTAFKLTPVGSGYAERVLWRFGHGTDGNYPQGGVVVDRNGSFYGTTQQGGSGYLATGTIFQLAPANRGYAESTVWNFGNGDDGREPQGRLIQDANGAIYGVTAWGGTSQYCGTVFRFTP